MLWTSEPDSLSSSACEQRAQLIRAFENVSLTLDPSLEKQAALRLRSAAETEWRRFVCPCSGAVSPARTKHLLGAGHMLTDFLISPARLSLAERSTVCSLGALVNLMVVVCDTLLDGGAVVEDVLPENELASGGGPGDGHGGEPGNGHGSAVTVLLQEYFVRLRAFAPDERVSGTARKVMLRMFEAEIQTVRLKAALPFRFWLRKSSLPFVAMALPVWTNGGHLRWLYQIGLLFGLIDDAVDTAADLANGHPNYWLRAGKELSEYAATRLAHRAHQVLTFWDNVVPHTSDTAVIRASFLYNIWRWLEPA